MRRTSMALAALLLAISAGASASAQERDHRGWHDRDIHRFHEHDFDLWRSGHWFHGRHGGRLGWWWIAGGTWYFYPQPVYPYPDPYLPPSVAASPAPPPQTAYYYCDRPAGYYPYVSACQVPWRTVPAG